MLLFVLLACSSLFLTPEEGNYSVEFDNDDANSACDDWGIEFEGDDVEFDVEVDDDSMEINDAFECDRSGSDFDCDAESESEVEDADATLAVVEELEGTWTSSTSFVAEYRVVFSCEGDDCGGVDDCEMSADIEAELD